MTDKKPRCQHHSGALVAHRNYYNESLKEPLKIVFLADKLYKISHADDEVELPLVAGEYFLQLCGQVKKVNHCFNRWKIICCSMRPESGTGG